MDQDGYNERITRLEAALLTHRGRTIVKSAIGEIDTGELLREMRRLGFTFLGSEPQGLAYAAEFRRPGVHGAPAQHAVATSYSEHNAILEAAIAGLTGASPVAERDSSLPPGSSPQHVQRWLPSASRPRSVGAT